MHNQDLHKPADKNYNHKEHLKKDKNQIKKDTTLTFFMKREA